MSWTMKAGRTLAIDVYLESIQAKLDTEFGD